MKKRWPPPANSRRYESAGFSPSTFYVVVVVVFVSTVRPPPPPPPTPSRSTTGSSARRSCEFCLFRSLSLLASSCPPAPAPHFCLVSPGVRCVYIYIYIYTSCVREATGRPPSPRHRDLKPLLPLPARGEERFSPCASLFEDGLSKIPSSLARDFYCFLDALFCERG